MGTRRLFVGACVFGGGAKGRTPLCSCSVSWCPSLACWLRLLCCQCLAVPGGSGFLPAGVAPCVLGASCAPCSAVAGLCLALVCLFGWLCGLRCWVCEGGRLFACPAVGPLRSPLVVPAPRQRLCFWGLGPGFSRQACKSHHQVVMDMAPPACLALVSPFSASHVSRRSQAPSRQRCRMKVQ